MKWIFCLFVFIFTSSVIFSQSVLTDVHLVSPRGVVLHFDDVPESILYTLSEDKTLITVELQNVSRNTSKKTYSFLSAVIRECSIEERASNTIVRVQLNSKNGFTISNLGFSKSLYLEVFQWDKISNSEDVYRTGILSLTDKLPDLAKKYFDSAYSLGNSEVNVVRAKEELNKKNYAFSLEYALKGIENKSVHPDNFAMVYLLFKTHNKEIANLYLEQFELRTGIKNILFDNDIGKFKIPIQLDSLAVELSRTFDTNSTPKGTDSSRSIASVPDTLQQIITKIQRPPLQAFKPSNQTIVLGSLVVLILGSIVIFRKSLFPKKKVKNVEEKEVENSQNVGLHFDEVLKDEDETLSEYQEIIAEYEQNELRKFEEAQKEEISEPSTEEMEEIERSKIVEIERKEKVQFPNQQDEFLKSIQDIAPLNMSTMKGKIDFAENLKEQIFLKKEETISNLHDTDIPENSFEKTNFAKELGLEKEVLDTEKSIQELNDDEETKKALKKKFT